MKLSQTLWEAYFIASIIFCLAMLFIGTLDGSASITVYPYILVISFINVGIVSYIGTLPSEDTDSK